MKHLITITIIFFAGIFQVALATETSPEGQWTTIDDDTGEAKSIINLWLEGSELKGQITHILDEAKKKDLCVECSGSRKDKPIEGMIFVWGLEEDDGMWTGGKILDPNNGKEYKANLTVINDGANLEVRGYIGFALLGRTQVWNKY